MNPHPHHRVAVYAVILCPEFPLQAVRRHGGGTRPMALAEGGRGHSIVVCCNVAAAAQGIHARLSTIQALARCPTLVVDSPSPAAEAVAMRTLLAAADHWLPGVEESAPGMLTLDLATQAAPHHLPSARACRSELFAQGLDVAIGIAKTPELAQIAARAAHAAQANLGSNDPRTSELSPDASGIFFLDAEHRLAALDRMPIALADTSSALAEHLSLCGFRSLGAFSRLTHQAVAARFGAEGVDLWLRLEGRRRRPLRLVKEEERFEERHDFELATTDRAQVSYFLEQAIAKLSGRLSRAGKCVAAAQLYLSFSDGSHWGKRIELPEPTLDGGILLRFLQSQVDTVEARSAWESIRLRFFPTHPVGGERPLFGQGLRHREQCEATVARLQKLLGNHNVGSPRHANRHDKNGLRLLPLSAELREIDLDSLRQAPQIGPVFRRYPLPPRATVYWRDGHPLRVESSRVSGVVADSRGPWITDGGWWHQGRAWQRIEWDIELMHHGLFRLVKSGGDWKIEGYYD